MQALTQTRARRLLHPRVGRGLHHGGPRTRTKYSYVLSSPLRFSDPFGLDVYRGPGNYYSDIPPSSGCQRAIFAGDYIVGWGPCSQSPAPATSGSSSECSTSDPRILADGPILPNSDFDWKGFAWELVRPDWTIVLGAAGKAGKFWKGLNAYRKGIRTNGLSGKSKRYYEWDHAHGDVEVYNRHGVHLGTANPATGEMIKRPVKGRTLGEL